MVKFSQAIAVRIKDAVVNDPELFGLRIDINAGHDADALDNGVSIAAVLATHQFDGKRIVFIRHRVIKEQVTFRRGHDSIFDLFPQQARRQFVATQVSVQMVMAVVLAMVSKVGERVIDLTTEQILTVIKSGRSVVGRNHAAIIYNLAFCVSPIYINSKKPSAGIIARLRLKASRNDGFSVTVLLRALISRALMDASLAQDGISPYPGA
jgi:hypothetical protein